MDFDWRLWCYDIWKNACRKDKRHKLQQQYGEDFPVLIWTLTDHVPTDKSFYASIINAMDIGEIKTRTETALNLKERVINYMRIRASMTPLKRIVFMIDEAWKLAAKEFDWLMDLNMIFKCLYFFLEPKNY